MESFVNIENDLRERKRKSQFSSLLRHFFRGRNELGEPSTSLMATE